MMYDLTNIRKSFNELILSKLSEEILKRNNIGEFCFKFSMKSA